MIQRSSTTFARQSLPLSGLRIATSALSAVPMLLLPVSRSRLVTAAATTVALRSERLFATSAASDKHSTKETRPRRIRWHPFERQWFFESIYSATDGCSRAVLWEDVYKEYEKRRRAYIDTLDSTQQQQQQLHQQLQQHAESTEEQYIPVERTVSAMTTLFGKIVMLFGTRRRVVVGDGVVISSSFCEQFRHILETVKENMEENTNEPYDKPKSMKLENAIIIKKQVMEFAKNNRLRPVVGSSFNINTLLLSNSGITNNTNITNIGSSSSNSNDTDIIMSSRQNSPNFAIDGVDGGVTDLDIDNVIDIDNDTGIDSKLRSKRRLFWSHPEDLKLQEIVEKMSQESLRKRFISHLKDEQRSRLRYKRAKRRSDDDKINVTEPVIEVSSDGYLDLKRWVSWGKVADELGSGRSGEACRRRYEVLEFLRSQPVNTRDMSILPPAESPTLAIQSSSVAVTGEHGLVVDQHEIIRRNWASHQLFRSMKSYKDQILSSLDKLDKVWDQHHEQQQLQQLRLQQPDTFLTQLPLNESVDTSIQPSKLHSPKLQKQPTKNEAHIQLLRETVGAATRAVVRKWTPEEDKILKLFVETHGHKWQAASQLLPGRSKASCYCRWVYSLSPDCNKEDWTEAEIERLVYIVRRLHPSAFYLKWQPDVDLPAIVGKVPQPPADDPHLATLVDEEIAKHKQSKNGQTRGKLTSAHWGTIAKLHGNGRPLDQCKTRFSTHLYSIARQHGLVFSGPWTADEDARLVDAVKTIYKGALNATATAGSDKESLTLQQMHTWQAVAQLVGTRSMRYCRSRWMRMHAKNHNLDL